MSSPSGAGRGWRREGGRESPHRQEQDPLRHWLLKKRSSKQSTKGPLSCQPPAPSNHTPGVPEGGWPLSGLSGCHPGPLEWPAEWHTHPSLLLFGLELGVDLLWARVLPGPAFVAPLSPCTRTRSLGRQQDGSSLDRPELQTRSCLRCSQQRLPTSLAPHQDHPPTCTFPLTCSKGQKRQHVAAPTRVWNAGSHHQGLRGGPGGHHRE